MRITLRWAVAVVGMGLLGWSAGCGGSDDESLYDNSSGGSSGSAGSSAAGGGGAAGGSSSGGSSATGGSSSGGSAGSSGGAGGGGTAGSAGATGGSAGVAGSGATGGSVAGTDAVNCGGPICDVAQGQRCCVVPNDSPKCFDPSQEQCDCGIVCDEIVVACDGPEDCDSGDVCCDEDVVAGPHHLVCLADCTRSITTPRREICHPNVSGGCSSGNCTAANNLPAGYGYCAQ